MHRRFRPAADVCLRPEVPAAEAAESLFQLLKRERIRRRTYLTRDAARQDVFDHVGMFYNPKRKHTNDGMLPPVDFENRRQKLNEAGVQETRGTSVSKYHLPTLDLFHTFEAVARHRSFTLAADELCLTQSAVSRQIKTLEDALGLRLFRRLHRAIEVTAEGQRLFESVTRGLEDISACLAALGAAAKAPQITVSASVAFAWFWLMPRLQRFDALQPDVDLRVLATDQPVLPGSGEVDVAILFGSGQWDGLEARLLFGERVCPVCSPAYLGNHPELRRAEDLLDQTLLHLEYGKPSLGGVDWRTWLLRQGVNGQPVRRGLRFNSYPMVLQAAEAGHGVALGWSYVTDPMLADGRLVCPVNLAVETQDGYYLCTSKETVQTPGIMAFLDWINTEAKAKDDIRMIQGNANHSE